MSIKKNKFFLYLAAALVMSILASSVNVYFSSYIAAFDGKLKDNMFLVRGSKPNADNVLIIDIDEKSLLELGQWPWSRIKVAQIIQNLTDSGIGIVGADIVFAEEDQSSPSKVLSDLEISGYEAPDYDRIFNEVVASTPTILGYQFELEDKEFIKHEELDIPAIIIEKNKPEYDYLINAKGTILNHPSLQESAYSSGFFNNIPDDSGVIRSVPLIIRYDDQVYPSLALEMIRASMGINNVFINYSELGVENIQIGDFKIPTDRHGRIVVNFIGPSGSFKYYSAVDIYNGDFNPKDFDGKVAIIGTTAAGLKDLRSTPFESVYPGVEVHANIIDNILNEDFLQIPTWANGADLLILFTVVLLTFLLTAYTPLWFNPIAFLGMLSAVVYFVYFALFEHGIIFQVFLPISAVAASVLVSTFMGYMLEMKYELLIKKKFASKVSKDVMESLLKDPGNDVFEALNKEVSITFSDVRGFTNISESMSNANVLIDFMNKYMNPMTQIIIREKGTVDKFIGDAIMAYWNAPGNVEQHAERAVIATLEQLHALDDLNEELKKDERFTAVVAMSEKKGIPIIDIGIGINTGVCVVGEMGSDERSDYTVIGDPVNLAARLESLCKFYNSKCNISNFTKEQLRGDYIYRFLDLVTVKGKSEPIEVWQIVDYDRDESMHKLYHVSRARLDEELDLYHKAIALYKDANFKDALDIFKTINDWEDKTNKNIYNIYIERCEHYIKEPPKDFDGVFVHTTKG